MFRILPMYLAAIMAWSTTPIGVQFSSITLHPMMSLYYRLTLTSLLGYCCIKLFRVKFPWHRSAVKAYAILGGSVGGGLAGAYIGLQKIPSGLGAVIFGLSPLFALLVERVMVPDTRISLMRAIACIIGLIGLVFIYLGRNPAFLNANASLDPATDSFHILMLSSLWLMSSMVVFTYGAVLLRQHLAHTKLKLNPFALSIGGFAIFSLLAGLVLLILRVWLPNLDAGPSNKDALFWEGMSVIYLAVVGSIIGFCSYNYIVIRQSVQSAAMVNIVTPIVAMALGVWLKNERLFWSDYLGSVWVLISIVVYVFGDQGLHYAKRIWVRT